MTNCSRSRKRNAFGSCGLFSRLCWEGVRKGSRLVIKEQEDTEGKSRSHCSLKIKNCRKNKTTIEARLLNQQVTMFNYVSTSIQPHVLTTALRFPTCPTRFVSSSIGQSCPVLRTHHASARERPPAGSTWPRPAPHSRLPIKENMVGEAEATYGKSLAAWMLRKVQVLAATQI